MNIKSTDIIYDIITQTRISEKLRKRITGDAIEDHPQFAIYKPAIIDKENWKKTGNLYYAGGQLFTDEVTALTETEKIAYKIKMIDAKLAELDFDVISARVIEDVIKHTNAPVRSTVIDVINEKEELRAMRAALVSDNELTQNEITTLGFVDQTSFYSRLKWLLTGSF